MSHPPQSWRVVINRGCDHTLTAWVRPAGDEYRAMDQGGAWCRGASPRHAVVALAARKGWDVVEIRGPGEATTAEQVERMAAVACEEIAAG